MQLVVDAQVEQHELKHSALDVEADAERPDILHLERSMLPNDLALDPRLTKAALLAAPMMVSRRLEGLPG